MEGGRNGWEGRENEKIKSLMEGWRNKRMNEGKGWRKGRMEDE